MADNIPVTPGAGKIVATDEVVDGTLGTVQVQYTKLMDGTLDGTNKLVVSATGAASVDGSGVTQPVSAASLPLPAGAATEATLSSLDSKVTAVDTGAVTISSALPAGSAVIGHVIADSGSTTAVTGNVTVVQPTGTNLHTVVDSGTVTLSGTSPVSGTVIANQGTPAATANRWPVQLTDGTNLAAVDAAGDLQVDVNNFPATQPISAVSLPLPSGASTSALQTQPGVDIGDVTVNNASGASAVNVQDGGNSITVDGTFFQATQPISAASLPLPSGASTSALQTQPGVDIGDVTINNTSGAGAVNIQDGGNSITVDGTVTTTPPSNASTNVAQFGGTNVSTGTGAGGVGIPRVTVSSDSSLTATQGTAAADTAAWPIKGGVVTAVTAAWTSATATNTTLALATTDYGQVLGTEHDVGTVSGGLVVFEVSDDGGTNWYATFASTLGGSNTNNALSLGGGNVAFSSAISGATNYRIRLSGAITGSGTVNFRLQASAFPYNPGIITNLQNVNGSGVATAASGVQKVGIVGNAGATLDGVITAATAPANGAVVLTVQNTTAPSLTTGQSVALQSDYEGSLFVKPYRRAQTTSKATTIASSSGTTTVLAAQAAGIFADISSLVITVTPAAATAIQFTATLSDGTNSYLYDLDTGTTAASSVAGTVNITWNPPLPATSAATAWTIALSVATVTVHITVVAALQKAG